MLAAAQTTVIPAAKVTPHLSAARRPAEPPNRVTRCQNPASGSLLALTDVGKLLDMSNPLFFICYFLATPVTQTDGERAV